jgi:REP element-mobilizing transposase RayT
MARPLRIEFPGAIYHVTSRMVGSWRERGDRLFRDERDYQRFVDRLEERVKEAGVRLYLFCLMSNHFHLLLETPEGNLSRFMQRLTTAYTVYYNHRHDRHGHVLDGRFKAKLVSGDEYLLRLSRYVHQNPAWVSGWAKRPLKERIGYLQAYPWSSYPSYIARSRPLQFVDYGPILKMTAKNAGEGRSGYRRYALRGVRLGGDR